jgi:glucose-6-phosphate 1-dehydrogenase
MKDSGSPVSGDFCGVEIPQDPSLIVIFGATGDLTSRKLIPALFSLYRRGYLPSHFGITGCGRTPMTDVSFRAMMRDAAVQPDDSVIQPDDSAIKSARGDSLATQWDVFEKMLFYHHVDYSDHETYESLALRLSEIDKELKTEGNKIFYVALPPFLYPAVARGLGKSGLSTPIPGEVRGVESKCPWARFVVEKPFGSDLETAIELDEEIHKHFKESEIFRIDHYLAKETVQNILVLRFANEIFGHLWNRQYIDKVVITAAESLGVGHRAGYYEESGVLRDMFQNHMMQLLALTAMEAPVSFNEKHVRDEKAKVFHSLRPFDPAKIDELLKLGQYGAGTVNGEKVKAYREEDGVDSHSCTPTYGRMTVFVDNWRWHGVPFHLCSGKRLSSKKTEVVIHFKSVPMTMFRSTEEGFIPPNKLILGIYPDQKVSLAFQTKTPGSKVCMRPAKMSFNYDEGFGAPSLGAYETVFLECLIGDQLLFWRQDGVEACWKFMTPILGRADTCNINGDSLSFYASGSDGPVFASSDCSIHEGD